MQLEYNISLSYMHQPFPRQLVFVPITAIKTYLTATAASNGVYFISITTDPLTFFCKRVPYFSTREHKINLVGVVIITRHPPSSFLFIGTPAMTATCRINQSPRSPFSGEEFLIAIASTRIASCCSSGPAVLLSLPPQPVSF